MPMIDLNFCSANCSAIHSIELVASPKWMNSQANALWNWHFYLVAIISLMNVYFRLLLVYNFFLPSFFTHSTVWARAICTALINLRHELETLFSHTLTNTSTFISHQAPRRRFMTNMTKEIRKQSCSSQNLCARCTRLPIRKKMIEKAAIERAEKRPKNAALGGLQVATIRAWNSIFCRMKYESLLSFELARCAAVVVASSSALN